MGRFQRPDEILGVERRADPRNVLRGVEIEVDLAVAQRLVGSGHDYSLAPDRVSAPAANWRWKTRKTISGTMVVTMAATERRSQLTS